MKETLVVDTNEIGDYLNDRDLFAKYKSSTEKIDKIFKSSRYKKSNWAQRHILRGRLSIDKKDADTYGSISFRQSTDQGLKKVSFILLVDRFNKDRLCISVNSLLKYPDNYFFIPGEDSVFRRICINSETYREDNLLNDTDRLELGSYFDTFDQLYSRIFPLES